VPGLGRAAVFGVYANVETPGRIAVGDRIRTFPYTAMRRPAGDANRQVRPPAGEATAE
jgi:hypothetical protein